MNRLKLCKNLACRCEKGLEYITTIERPSPGVENGLGSNAFHSAVQLLLSWAPVIWAQLLTVFVPFQHGGTLDNFEHGILTCIASTGPGGNTRYLEASIRTTLYAHAATTELKSNCWERDQFDVVCENFLGLIFERAGLGTSVTRPADLILRLGLGR